MKHRAAASVTALLLTLASTVHAWPKGQVVVTPPNAPKSRSIRKHVVGVKAPAGTPLVVGASRVQLAPVRAAAARIRPDALPKPVVTGPVPTATTTAPAPTASATTAPTSSAPATSTPSIVGSYTLAGIGNDGVKYTGTATLTLIGGDMFSATWSIGDNKFYGNCLRDGATLSCAWALKAADANVAAYLVTPDGLDGVWFSTGDTRIGAEYLKPTAGGAPPADLAGAYTIVTGHNPDGSVYGGTVDVKASPGTCAGCTQMRWTLGSVSQPGVAVRSKRGGQDVLAAAFVDGNADYGALAYAISLTPDGKKRLDGVWIQSISGAVSAGTETATSQ